MSFRRSAVFGDWSYRLSLHDVQHFVFWPRAFSHIHSPKEDKPDERNAGIGCLLARAADDRDRSGAGGPSEAGAAATAFSIIDTLEESACVRRVTAIGYAGCF